MIHPSAIVSPLAKVAADVRVGPYAIVEDDVEIGDGSVIEAHAVLKDGARLGARVTVGSFAAVAGLPQDLSFKAETKTYARIGDGTTLREGVTVNRSTKEGSSTVVGAGCFLMAAAHVGHDCVVGDRVIIGNASLLAGHVSVGSNAFLGGSAGIHQFCRIGAGVMFGGASVATMDVAPFTKFADRNALFGLNVVGLRRRGASRETIAALQFCYRKVLMESGNVRATAASLLADGYGEQEETRVFLQFFEGGKRGFVHPGRGKG